MMSDENMKEPIECSGSCGIETPHWASFHATRTSSSEGARATAIAIVAQWKKDIGQVVRYERMETDIANALITIRNEYALCAQVQKRGEHSSVTCPCVVAVEESIRNAERTRVWEKAIEVAQISTKKSIAARLNVATAEILIRRLEAAANDEAKGEG